MLVELTGLDNLLWQQRRHPKTTLQLTGEGEGHETTPQLTGELGERHETTPQLPREGEGHDYCTWCQKK